MAPISFVTSIGRMSVWENHTDGHVCRFGVWVNRAVSYGWTTHIESRPLQYSHETLVTQVALSHPDLQLDLICQDAVDFHENLYLRCIEIRNAADRDREVRLFSIMTFISQVTN